MDVAVIIAAAGRASRMNAAKNKALLPLAGKPVLAWSLELFENSAAVCEIYVAAAPAEFGEIEALCRPYSKVKAVINGGTSRIASVAAALSRVSSRVDRVAVHDAARPLLHEEDWQALLAVSAECPAALLAEPAADSMKLIENDTVLRSLPREHVVRAQTPQIFAYEILLAAYRNSLRSGLNATDDSALAEAVGQSSRVVLSRHPNFKLTYEQDLHLAELILRQRLEEQA